MEKDAKKWPRAARGRFSTMRSRLIALVLLASLPALSLIAYTNIEQRRHDTDEAVSKALESVRHAAHHHSDLVEETRTILSVLAGTLDFEDQSGLSKAFSDMVARRKTYAFIGFLDAKGNLVAGSIPFASPVYGGDRPYFRRAVESRDFAAGDFQVGRLTKAAGISFGYPVLRQGRLRGVLFASVPIEALQRQLARVALQPGQVLSIADRNGTLLARHPPDGRVAGESIKDTDLGFLLGQAAPEGSARAYGTDGVERLYSHIRIELAENSAIIIISATPASAVYAKADRLLTRNLVTSAAITALVLLLAWVASEGLVLKSVRGLVAVTKELGAGKRKSRARVDGASLEINLLAESLNEMADALEARQEESERHLARIARLNRVYAVLSGINAAIIRDVGKEELLREACRIAVEQGSFSLACASLADKAGRLYPAALAGGGEEYVERLVERASGEAGFEPLARRAFTEDREVLSAEAKIDGRLAPWLELAESFGYRSAAAFPLRVEGRPVGAITLYSTEPSFFDDHEELRLLREFASDTSLGLERIEKEQRIEYLSRCDMLTGLVNRFIFEDHLDQAITRARHNQRHVTVVMIDIEDFGRINDDLGHAAGDEVLKAVAGYLAGSVRDGDTVARLGNDNFGVILQDLADREDSVTVVEKLMHGLPSSVTVAGDGVFIRTYAGISVFPNDGTTPGEIMQSAELAMHSCGAQGTDRVLYYAKEINDRALEQRRIERALRGAIAKKELSLVYQPIVAVEDRRLVALEALLRWKNDELGEVPPDRFIPVAEKTGLIVPIGEWVLKTAVAQAREWERRGAHGIKLGVNVSVRQIKEPDFCERAARIIGHDPGSRPVRLAMEVTESELMKNMDIFVKSLIEVRRLGLSTYIDDFGTGYSSLSYLKDLPVDTLKIDRSFITDIATDSSSMSMAMGIIAIANSLGLEVVAEGVETEEQLAILSDLGCPFAQGYLFSKPLPAHLIEPMLPGRG